MSFLTSICLSNIGSIPQDGLVNLFTNVDNYTTPIQTGIAISAMTGNQCPYYVSVPDGTTEIRIINSATATRICLQITDPCTSCDLGFDVYNQNSIGQVVVGNLTGSCGTITDYLINWYGPQNNSYDPANPSQNIAFTSGKGTLFPGYNFLHPMTGTQSPPMIPGNYVPVISKVKIGTTIYSLTGESGTVQSNLNCLYPTIIISAYTCSDTNITGDYSTQIKFRTTGEASVPPTALSTVLKIDTNINYLVLKFVGYDIPDIFNIQFSGTSYSTPLTLENIMVGTQVPIVNGSNNDFLPLSMPKKRGDSEFKKVLCFTGLTRTSDDYLLISVIPNQQNNATSWDIYWKCLETFDCSLCVDKYRNTPYKIFGSSINQTVSQCNDINLFLRLSGCSSSDNKNNLVDKYIQNYHANMDGNGPQNEIYFLNQETASSYCLNYNDPNAGLISGGTFISNYYQCRPTPGTGTITTKKYLSGITSTNTINVVEFTFTDYNDFDAYYSSYIRNRNAWYGTPFDPTDLRYYRAHHFQISTASGTQNCGDNSGKIDLWIHTSTDVFTGLTNGVYTLSFSMPQMVNQIPDNNCDYCRFLAQQVVNITNNSINYPNFSFSSTVGARFIVLNSETTYITRVTSTLYDAFLSSYYDLFTYSYKTFVFSGNSGSYVSLPSLSASTCNFDNSLNSGNVSDITTRFWFSRNMINYPDIYNPADFRIYCNQISNWDLGTQELAYTYSGGTVQYSNPNYII